MQIDPVARIEHQLAIAQQITHIGSWEWERATNRVTWSDELYRIYGFAPRSREITLEFFLSRVHPEDRARVQEAVQGALARGGRFQWVERIVRPDGSVRELDTIGEVRSDESGAPIALVGTCRDVTDERRRDEQLRRYADIVRHVQIGLAVWNVHDPDDVGSVRLLAYNPAAERIARRSLDGEIGKPLREVIPYAAGGVMESLILQVAREGGVRESSVIGSRDPRDPRRAVSIKAFDLPGKCVGVALEDVTAATVARKLQDAEQRVLEQIAEGAPLGEILAMLVAAVEEHSPPVVGAIHLRDADGERYPARVAPHLSSRPGDLHVYASARILARDQRDLGDFVLYLEEQRSLGDDDRATLARAAHLARIAIERRQLEDQLRELSAHVESVREDERTGIAREIHDELGQALTALKMDIAWIVRRASSESITLTKDGLLEKLGAMSKLTDDVIQQVRRISAELRPGVLDDLGLIAAIEWQAQEFERRTGTTCAVRSNVSDAALDRDVATAAFRIFQEALTNVTRHAKAAHVAVAIDVRDGALSLEVRDDGVGIRAEAARSPRSLGLVGIRERAHRLGGAVSVEPSEPRGTRVALRVPLRGAR